MFLSIIIFSKILTTNIPIKRKIALKNCKEDSFKLFQDPMSILMDAPLPMDLHMKVELSIL
jgi:hypothetical protein